MSESEVLEAVLLTRELGEERGRKSECWKGGEGSLLSKAKLYEE